MIVAAIGEAVAGGFVGAVVGGFAAAVGSRWAVAQDLTVRNRHALLMEDIPWYRSTEQIAWQGIEAMAECTRERSEALTRIEVRAQLLSPEEAELGLRIREDRDNEVSPSERVEKLEALARSKLRQRWWRV